MKKVHVMLGLMVFLMPLQAQADTKVDSLKRLLQSEVPIDRAEVLWSIAYELFDVDNEQAVFYAERAYHDVWQRGDSLQIVKVGTTFGQLLRRVGKLAKSIEVLEPLLIVSRRNDLGTYTKKILNALGIAFTYREEFDKALLYQYESLELRKKDNDPSEVSLALMGIGWLQYKLNDYELSIKYSQQSIDISMSVGDSSLLSGLYSNLGAAYQGLKQHELAIRHYREALTITTPVTAYFKSVAFYGIAESLYALGRLDSARSYALKAMSASSKYSDRWFESFSFILLAEIEMDKGRFHLAQVYLDSLDRIVSEYPFVRVRLTKTRCRLLSGIGDFKNALYELEQHLALRDSIYSDEAENRVLVAQLEFHQRENENKIQSQKSMLMLQRDSIEKQRTVLILVIVLVFLLLVLAGALFKLNARKSLINSILDQRVRERTAELVEQAERTNHAIKENMVRNIRVARELKEAICTTKGLLLLKQNEIEHQNFRQHAEMTMDWIAALANKLE